MSPTSSSAAANRPLQVNPSRFNPGGTCSKVIEYDDRTEFLALLALLCGLHIALSQACVYIFRGRDRMALDATITIRRLGTHPFLIEKFTHVNPSALRDWPWRHGRDGASHLQGSD